MQKPVSAEKSTSIRDLGGRDHDVTPDKPAAIDAVDADWQAWKDARWPEQSPSTLLREGIANLRSIADDIAAGNVSFDRIFVADHRMRTIGLMLIVVGCVAYVAGG